MTQHTHTDGITPTLHSIRTKLEEGKFDHSIEPTIQALQNKIDALEVEISAWREAMHSIYWLNMHPQIDAICTEIYNRYEPPKSHIHTPETDATGHRVCGECRLSLEDS